MLVHVAACGLEAHIIVALLDHVLCVAASDFCLLALLPLFLPGAMQFTCKCFCLELCRPVTAVLCTDTCCPVFSMCLFEQTPAVSTDYSITGGSGDVSGTCSCISA
jgi:hypothetical protein